MKNTVRIIAQTYENKAFSEGGEAWRPKGAQEFSIEMEVDHLMYCAEDAIATIKHLIAEQDNKLYRHEYVSHEIVWHNPIVLDAAKFDALMELCNKSRWDKLEAIANSPE